MFKDVDITGVDPEALFELGENAFKATDFECMEHCFRVLSQRESKDPLFRELYIEALIEQFKYELI